MVLSLLGCGFAVGFVVGRDRPNLPATPVASDGTAPPATASPAVPVAVATAAVPAPVIAGSSAAAVDAGATAEPTSAAAADAGSAQAGTADAGTADAAPAAQDAGAWLVPPDKLGPNTEGLPEAVRRRLPNTPYSLAGIPLIGDVYKARVAITVFGDFQCPYTKQGLDLLLGAVKKYGPELVIGYRHFPLELHENARPAAIASMAAAKQGKFWEYAKLLLERQDKLGPVHLRAYAAELGLDLAAYDAAITSEDAAIQLKVDKLVADGIEVEGTPTVLINGYRLFGLPDANGLEVMIEASLGEVRGNQATGLDLITARGQACDRAAMRMPLKGKEETGIDVLRRLPLDEAPRMGAADPLVGVVVFSDFQCPPCAATSKQLAAFVGKHDDVAVSFRHRPLAVHKSARDAAVVAEFANDNGKFWEMHDRLFTRQDALDRAALVGHATSLGLDGRLLEKALANNSYRDVLDRDLLLATRLGVMGTPTMFVNGRPIPEGATDEQLEQAYQDAKEQADVFIKLYKLSREGYYGALMEMVKPN